MTSSITISYIVNLTLGLTSIPVLCPEVIYHHQNSPKLSLCNAPRYDSMAVCTNGR